jgi:hypothetical protein
MLVEKSSSSHGLPSGALAKGALACRAVVERRRAPSPLCAVGRVPCVKNSKIAKRTQFSSKHAVVQSLTTKKFPFFSKANLMTEKIERP